MELNGMTNDATAMEHDEFFAARAVTNIAAIEAQRPPPRHRIVTIANVFT
jgi:hypothetical protein